MSDRLRLTVLQGMILGMRVAGLSNSEIAYRLGRLGLHETSRESICTIVTQMRGRGIEIPLYEGEEQRTEVWAGTVSALTGPERDEGTDG